MSASAAASRPLSHYARLGMIYSLKPLRHLIPKRDLSPQETQKLCYLLATEWCYKVCGISCWAECAPNETFPYRNKYQQILDMVGCDRTTRLLEIGPGTGELMKMASARASTVTGVDISPEVVLTCKEKGLQVIEGDAVPTLESLPAASFDVVIANSSMEHAVNERDALRGTADAIYERLFRAIHRVLAPGGRAYLSMIHTKTPEDPADAIVDPFSFPVLSKKFHIALLTQTFSGWYPMPGQLERNAARVGLRKAREVEATTDYLGSCENWTVLASCFDPFVVARVITNKKIRETVAGYPYYCYLMFIKLLAQTWTWQFTPDRNGGSGAVPMVYFCQVYQKA